MYKGYLRAVFSVVLAGAFLLVGALASAEPQTLIFGSTGEARMLDPHVTIDIVSLRPIDACYEGLVDIESGTSDVVPRLAESWTISPDGLAFTFHLRKGVKFTDGMPLDAEAVKFTFDRLLTLGLAPSGLFTWLDKVEVVDDQTVRFTLKEPFIPGLSCFATYYGGIISPGVMEHEVDGDLAQGWLSEHTAGTGPFYVEEWTHGVRIVLAKNEDYWGEPAKLDEVIIKYIPESSDVQMLLETGEIDIGESLSTDQVKNLREVSGIRVVDEPSFFVHYTYMNCQRPYLSDVRVRQAISYAVDYDGIMNELFDGSAAQMEGPVSPGMFGHEADIYQYHQDLDRARDLLAEAGYPGGGFTLKLMHTPAFPIWGTMGVVIQENLSKIGIQVELESLPNATLRDKLNKGDFDMSFGAWAPDYGDADMFTWYWYYSENWGLAGNRSWYKNSVMDDLVTQSRAEVDPDKRAALFRGIQWIGVSDAVYLYLVRTNYQLVMRDWVKGYLYTPISLVAPNFVDLYIEK